MLDVITQTESEVRSYVRTFPTLFTSAQGSILENENGFRFIDFYAGSCTLNYGHNNPRVKQSLLDYINNDGVQYSEGFATTAQVEFIRDFESIILRPRELDYKIQFTGTTGFNSVEAAITLARKVKQRSHIIAFTNARHGHSPSNMALTSQLRAHDEQYEPNNNVVRLPFDGYLADFDSSELLEKMLDDPGSGLPKPAAVILETVQCDGGIHVASFEWLRRVAEICRHQDILLIVDDNQVGNGRTGRYFSFEEVGIVPDMVCISKSIGGGLPLSLVLVRREIEFQPSEYPDTFCGNNLALVAARALLDYWRTDAIVGPSAVNQGIIEAALRRIAAQYESSRFDVRGRGMVWGIDVHKGDIAHEIVSESFQHGLLVETAGTAGQVIKLSPALTIEPNELQVGLRILDKAFAAVLASRRVAATSSDTCDFNMDATTVCD